MKKLSLTLFFLLVALTIHPCFSADEVAGEEEDVSKAKFQQIQAAGHSHPNLAKPAAREAFLNALVEADGKTTYNGVWEIMANEDTW